MKAEARLNQMHGRPYGWRGITLGWVARQPRPEWAHGKHMRLVWQESEGVFLALVAGSAAVHTNPAKALALARSKAVSELAKFSELIQSTE